jgi:hypothetical protein
MLLVYPIFLGRFTVLAFMNAIKYLGYWVLGKVLLQSGIVHGR